MEEPEPRSLSVFTTRLCHVPVAPEVSVTPQVRGPPPFATRGVLVVTWVFPPTAAAPFSLNELNKQFWSHLYQN